MSRAAFEDAKTMWLRIVTLARQGVHMPGLVREARNNLLRWDKWAQDRLAIKQCPCGEDHGYDPALERVQPARCPTLGRSVWDVKVYQHEPW